MFSNVIFLQKKARVQREMTIQDMYNQESFDDEDEEDDSDWEPIRKHVEVTKWFCTNCTMSNLELDDIVHCDVCVQVFCILLN